MPIQAVVKLDTLHCIAESDTQGSSHSEPYIWPFLAGVANNPASLATTPTSPILAESRKIIKNEMKAGDSASLDFPGNVLTQSFAEGQMSCNLILIVGLMEADENTVSSMQAGYQAFLNELKAKMPEIIALGSASPEEATVLLKEIKDAVSAKAHDAVKNSMSGYEKFKVFMGTMDTDDYVGTDFANFKNVEQQTAPVSFKLRMTGQATERRQQNLWVVVPVEYELDGTLTVSNIVADQCQAEVDGVAAAVQAIKSLQGQVRSLQHSLQTATPQQKAAIVNSIEKINSELLPAAEAWLVRAQKSLELCRIRGPVVGPLGGGGGVVIG